MRPPGVGRPEVPDSCGDKVVDKLFTPQTEGNDIYVNFDRMLIYFPVNKDFYITTTKFHVIPKKHCGPFPHKTHIYKKIASLGYRAVDISVAVS